MGWIQDPAIREKVNAYTKTFPIVLKKRLRDEKLTVEDTEKFMGPEEALKLSQVYHAPMHCLLAITALVRTANNLTPVQVSSHPSRVACASCCQGGHM